MSISFGLNANLLYSDVLDLISEGICQVSLDGKILYVNRAVEELTGARKEDIAGRNISELKFPDFSEQCSQRLSSAVKLAEAGKTAEPFTLSEKGSTLSVSPVTDTTAVVFILRNITEKMHIQGLLKEKRQLLDGVFESIQDGVSVLSEDLNIRYVNVVMNNWYSSNLPLEGKKCYEVYHNRNEVCYPCPTIRCLKTGKTEKDVIPGPSGSHVEWIELFSYPIRDSSTGKVSGVVEFVRDITERKKMELELVRAKEKAEESDRLKSAFLANMSHEIRTPMNGILGFAELLKEPELSGERQNYYIDIIEKSGQRMLGVINDIIDISKIESGEIKISKKELNLYEVVKDVYDFFKPEAEAKGISLLMNDRTDDPEILITTDGDKFYSILANLVKNAVKYTDDGFVRIGFYRKGNTVELFVRDTGIGISEDRQQVIFRRFVQADISDRTARPGAGLGLAIARAYVEILGGDIRLESKEGEGSTFSVILPVS